MIFGTDKLHKATNGMMPILCLRMGNTLGAPRVFSRVRLIQAANFQRKSHIRPRPIKLSVGNPASTFLISRSRRDLDTTFGSQILSDTGVNYNFSHS